MLSHSPAYPSFSHVAYMHKHIWTDQKKATCGFPTLTNHRVNSACHFTAIFTSHIRLLGKKLSGHTICRNTHSQFTVHIYEGVTYCAILSILHRNSHIRWKYVAVTVGMVRLNSLFCCKFTVIFTLWVTLRMWGYWPRKHDLKVVCSTRVLCEKVRHHRPA